MSVTFTRPLWNAQLSAPGVTLGPVVPATELWVVRDVTLFFAGNFPSVSIGNVLLEEKVTGTVLWGVGNVDAAPAQVFHAELRQALSPNNQLQCRADTAGWAIAVTGYVFSAP